MRIGLQILLFAALTVFLALQIPRKALFPHLRKGRSLPPPFASYVELGADEYANRMKLARMAWQVRARAAGRLDLEENTPLDDEVFAPPQSSFALPSMPCPPPVKVEALPLPALAPPSMASPAATPLPRLEDRRRDVLLDISSYETLNGKE